MSHVCPVKDLGLPGSLPTTTNARRYAVAAGMAETAIGIRWMRLASPAAPLIQLRLDPKTGFPETRPGVPGPWGSRLDGPPEPRPPSGQAPPAGRQPNPLEEPWPPQFLILLLAAPRSSSLLGLALGAYIYSPP